MVQLCILSDSIHLGQSSSFLHLHTSGSPKPHCNSIPCCLQKGKSPKIFKFLLTISSGSPKPHCNSIPCCLQKGKSPKLFKFLWTISLTKQSLGSRHSGGLEALYNIALYIMSFMFKLLSSNLQLYTKVMNGYLF